MAGYRPKSPHKVPERVLRRVFASVLKPAEGDQCWPWQKSTGSHGYGQVGWKVDGTGKNAGTTAHRVAWMRANGVDDIPEGMTVDHICRNRICCNPRHLRLLPNLTNARDNGQVSKTECPSGHPYDEDNTYRSKEGHRKCRTCARESAQRRAAS